MSILDEDIFEQAELPITINILKDVKDEDVPALLQAWYDFLYDKFMCMPCTGAVAYEILEFFEECVPGKAYRKFYPSSIQPVVGACVYTYAISIRTSYIERWKRIALSHIETSFFNENPPNIDRFDSMFMGLTGVSNCNELKRGDFRKDHTIVIQNDSNWAKFVPICSETEPQNKYPYFLDLINRLYLAL